VLDLDCGFGCDRRDACQRVVRRARNDWAMCRDGDFSSSWDRGRLAAEKLSRWRDELARRPRLAVPVAGERWHDGPENAVNWTCSPEPGLAPVAGQDAGRAAA